MPISRIACILLNIVSFVVQCEVLHCDYVLLLQVVQCGVREYVATVLLYVLKGIS